MFLMTLKDGFLLSSDTLLMVEQFHLLVIYANLRKRFFHEFQET